MSTPNNPHCEHQWPYRTCGNYELEHLTAAVVGAGAIAQLLLADANIAVSWRNADDPGAESQPFSERTLHGLLLALNVCIHDAESTAERLRDRAINDRGGGAQ